MIRRLIIIYRLSLTKIVAGQWLNCLIDRQELLKLFVGSGEDDLLEGGGHLVRWPDCSTADHPQSSDTSKVFIGPAPETSYDANDDLG